jgi:hypothetical protein
MTELYHSSTGETAEPEADPIHDAGEYSDQARYETTPDSDQSDTVTRTALADGDQLPTRQDARAATWGEDPEYDDQNDPGTEYDGDLDALTAEEDRLPTRQDARAATWGEDPDYYDENEPGGQYDGDLDALTADDHHTLDDDQGDLDQASIGQDAPSFTGLDAPPGEAPDSITAAPAEQDERSPAGTSERITELQAENAQLGKSITDLQARLDRLEHPNQAERTPFVSSRESSTAQQDAIEAENPQTQRRHLPTNEALALGAAATGGVITAVADYVPFVHADVAGIAASAVAVGAATVTWIRSRGEARHANRSQD